MFIFSSKVEFFAYDNLSDTRDCSPRRLRIVAHFLPRFIRREIAGLHPQFLQRKSQAPHGGAIWPDR
jgi:hypothetical protein